MKRLLGLILIMSLVLYTFPITISSATDDELKTNNVTVQKNSNYAEDEIIVAFKNDNKPFRKIKVPSGSVKAMVAAYSNKSNVKYAEPNYYSYVVGADFEIPNDPLYDYQWHLKDSDQGGVNAEAAWSDATGEGVIVAVIDTGVAYENRGRYAIAPDLVGVSIAPGYDFVNNDAHANDDHSHGTHVAGTILQSTNNGTGVAGVAFDATLMPIKVLNKAGSGSHSDIAEGIRYAADNGAKVINMSLGGPGSTTMLNAVAYAYNKGVTIVAAAGNDNGAVSYPAAYDDYVIAVGATRIDKARAPYSNYGSQIDVVAPGGDLGVDQDGNGYADGVLQNTFNPTTKNPKDFGYWFFQGTSMASPHVAGVAALILSKDMNLEPSEVQSILENSAIDLGTPGKDNTFGYGLVDALAAIQSIGSSVDNNVPVAIDATYDFNEDSNVAIELVGTDDDPDDLPLLTYQISTEPTHGILTGSGSSYTYTPGLDYFGSDSFTFTVSDGKDVSTPGTISLNILGINDFPKAVDDQVSTYNDEPVDIQLVGTDVDGDALTYSIISGPSVGSLSTPVGDMVTYTPDGVTIGQTSFIFEVSDGNGGTDQGEVIIDLFERPVAEEITVSIVMNIVEKRAGKNMMVNAVANVTTDLGGATIIGHWEGATSDTENGTEGNFVSDKIKYQSNLGTLTFIFVVDQVLIGDVVYVNVGQSEGVIQYP